MQNNSFNDNILRWLIKIFINYQSLAGLSFNTVIPPFETGGASEAVAFLISGLTLQITPLP